MIKIDVIVLSSKNFRLVMTDEESGLEPGSYTFIIKILKANNKNILWLTCRKYRNGNTMYIFPLNSYKNHFFFLDMQINGRQCTKLFQSRNSSRK